MASPADALIPLLRAVAVAADKAFAIGGRIPLAIEDMDRCLREILDPAGVIEVKMREDDVANVLGLEPLRFDLAPGRIVVPQLDAVGDEEKPAQALPHAVNVAQTEALVDQHEARHRCLDKQAVAYKLAQSRLARPAVHQPSAQGTHRSAIEVMDAHRRSHRSCWWP